MKIEFEIDNSLDATLLILLYKIINDENTDLEAEHILNLIDWVAEATPSLLDNAYNRIGIDDLLTPPAKALYLAVMERRGIIPDGEILAHAGHTE